MSTHATPGVWSYQRLDKWNYGVVVHTGTLPDGSPTWKTVCHMNWRSEEVEADTRLMAAAKDMLAALQGLVACIEFTFGKDAGAAQQAKTAIAKATGCPS